MVLEVAICLPQEATTIARVRSVVTSALGLFDVTPECVDAIRLALSEACTNVLEHAASDDEYEVRLEIDDDRCAISVRNAGNGFDAAALDGVMPDAGSHAAAVLPSCGPSWTRSTSPPTRDRHHRPPRKGPHPGRTASTERTLLLVGSCQERVDRTAENSSDGDDRFRRGRRPRTRCTRCPRSMLGSRVSLPGPEVGSVH
jgi:serine/threonine-protein kinase RsbW